MFAEIERTARRRRELLEETGLPLQLDPWVWTRRHSYVWRGRERDQYERFFGARGADVGLFMPGNMDRYVIGHRWWAIDEMRAADDDFSPRSLAHLLPAILQDEYPPSPIELSH